MADDERGATSDPAGSPPPARRFNPFNNIKFFVFCHSLLQLAQLLVSGYMKSSISTIERRYGLSSKKSGLIAAFNEVGSLVLIIFVSFLGSRVHRPRFIGGGALLACLASLVMALPHFLSGSYEYTTISSATSNVSSGLCQSESLATPSPNKTCEQPESSTHQSVFPLLLFGQLLLGIGAVPIQPFGISYIDDHASRKNSPLYLGILLAVTTLGPAFSFLSGAFMLRFFVDFDKLPRDQIQLDHTDLRWVGAWWLGFLVASCLLFLTALPYLFFPRKMPQEDADADADEPRPDGKQQTGSSQEVTLLHFLKSFPRIALQTVRSPIYLLVVLAQVNLAALLVGTSIFMVKFIETQFNMSAAAANGLMGGVCIPMVVLGIILGGVLMRRLNLSVRGAGKLCSTAVVLCLLFALPLLFIGCPTQPIAGTFPPSAGMAACSAACHCSQEAFNPVCGADGVEFRSPCHAGCVTMETDANNKATNFTGCRCVKGVGVASPGTCGSRCSHLLLPFMGMLGLTGFIASFSQTPSFMMILRSVPPEDKSFAVGVQYMLFRVLAFLPGPVLYGSVIDSTCILWGRKCHRETSCLYYNLEGFRQRFLGLQVVFVCGALLCFLLTVVVLRRRAGPQGGAAGKDGYELVGGGKAQQELRPTEKELMGAKEQASAP